MGFLTAIFGLGVGFLLLTLIQSLADHSTKKINQIGRKSPYVYSEEYYMQSAESLVNDIKEKRKLNPYYAVNSRDQIIFISNVLLSRKYGCDRSELKEHLNKLFYSLGSSRAQLGPMIKELQKSAKKEALHYDISYYLTPSYITLKYLNEAFS